MSKRFAHIVHVEFTKFELRSHINRREVQIHQVWEVGKRHDNTADSFSPYFISWLDCFILDISVIVQMMCDDRPPVRRRFHRKRSDYGLLSWLMFEFHLCDLITSWGVPGCVLLNVSSSLLITLTHTHAHTHRDRNNLALQESIWSICSPQLISM